MLTVESGNDIVTICRLVGTKIVMVMMAESPIECWLKQNTQQVHPTWPCFLFCPYAKSLPCGRLEIPAPGRCVFLYLLSCRRLLLSPASIYLKFDRWSG